jgi:anti-sigma-K factor RskA
MSSVPPSAAAPELPGTEPPDDELLAGELVLGVLSGAERRGAQARAESDALFAERIGRWEQRFAPWLAQFEPVEPPPRIWPQICQRLGWQIPPAARARWWQSLALWRTATVLAALAALGLWLLRPLAPPPVAALPPAGAETAATQPVTTLAHDDGSPGWLASVDRARGTVLMVPVPGTPDLHGRVAELWIIPAGQAPRSLGAVSVSRAHTVAVPADARAALVPGSVLAITLEPASGVPHAAPTGAIIAKGAIQT